MPGLSGTQLTDRLREFDVKTPTVFYLARAYQADRATVLLSGSQGAVVKPVDTDELIALVVRLISESMPIAVKIVVNDGA